MSGKDESAAKKKKAAQQKQIAENQMIAKALKVTYHAACKAMDVKPQKTLVQSIDQAEDGVKVIDKVAFRDYTVSGRGVRAICDVLAGYGLCKNLCFWHCNVGDEGVDAICDLLKASTSPWSKGSKLALLEITSDFDQPLLEAYPFHDTKCDFNLLPDEGGPAGVAVHKADSKAAQLRSMDPITAFATLAATRDGPIAPRAPELPGHNELVSTCYAEGKISLTGLERLGSTLGRTGITLRVLVLDHNGIGDGGATMLCKGLRTCPSLRQLSLAYNGIGASGAQTVSALLWPTASPQLMMLNMQGNFLGDEGLIFMAKGIGASGHLRAINLAMNRMGGNEIEPVRTFCEGMSANNSLVRIDLGFNQFSTDQAREFLPVLVMKTNIKQFRFSSRIAREVADQLFSIIKKRNSKKKGKGGKKSKKK